MTTSNPPTKVGEKLPLRDDMLRLQRSVDGEPVTASTLPANLRDPTTSDLEYAPSRLVVGVATEISYKGSDVLLLDSLHVASSPNTPLASLGPNATGTCGTHRPRPAEAPADGMTTFAKMLYFFPSIASVFVKPRRPAFAVE